MPRTSKRSAKSLAKASDSVSCTSVRAVVGERDALAQGAVAQIDRARDMHGVLQQDDPAVGVDVGVGEIDVVVEIVVLDRRAQQQRLGAVDHQLQVREVARVAVEQAIGAAAGGADVAVAVEHGKGVVVLERAPRARGGAGSRDVEGRFARRCRRLHGCECRCLLVAMISVPCFCTLGAAADTALMASVWRPARHRRALAQIRRAGR